MWVVDGAFVVVGSTNFPLLAVATEARKQGQSLDAHFERDALTGKRLPCRGRTGPGYGPCAFAALLTADDHGVMVNHAGGRQSHGAIAGRLAGAAEQLQYDQSELTGSYMDTQCRADDLQRRYAFLTCAAPQPGALKVLASGAIAGLPAIGNRDAASTWL